MTLRLLDYALGALCLFLLWGYASKSCESARLVGEVRAEAARADSLAAEAAALDLRLGGWDVFIESTSPGRLQSVLDSIPILRDRLEAARIRISSLSQSLVSASGQVEIRVDTVVVSEVGDSVYKTDWSDEILEASTSFNLASRGFGTLTYDLLPQPVTYIFGQTGSGQGWVQARSPTLKISQTRAYFDLPEPEVVVRHSFWRTLRDIGIGFGGGYLACRVE